MSLDPTTLDASTINEASEFQMFLFDDAEWNGSLEHQQKLEEKAVAYIENARSQPKAKGRKLRITVVGMYEPDEAGNVFLFGRVSVHQ